MARAGKAGKKNSIAGPISNAILVVRGHKVMLETHLAALYDVPTKTLNQAVTRNRGRFAENFMFRLSWDEASLLRSQFVTSSRGAPD